MPRRCESCDGVGFFDSYQERKGFLGGLLGARHVREACDMCHGTGGVPCAWELTPPPSTDFEAFLAYARRWRDDLFANCSSHPRYEQAPSLPGVAGAARRPQRLIDSLIKQSLLNSARGDSKSRQDFRSLLTETEPDWGEYVVDALVVSNDSGALNVLVSSVQDGGLNGDNRWRVIDALISRNDLRAIALLKQRLFSDDWDASKAAQALERLGGKKAIKILSEFVHDDEDHNESAILEAVSALGRIGGSDIALTLVKAFRYPFRELKWDEVIISALANKGRAAIDACIAALQNSEPRIRKRAALALGELGDASTIRPLLEKLTADSKMATTLADSLRRVLKRGIHDAHTSDLGALERLKTVGAVGYDVHEKRVGAQLDAEWISERDEVLDCADLAAMARSELERRRQPITK